MAGAVQDIAVNIQSEVKAQGLSELEKMSEEIIQIAGAGNVASESITVLQYVLSTLQNTKGLASMRNISTVLKNALQQVKQISNITDNQTRNNKFKDLYSTTLQNVTNQKKFFSQGLTAEELKGLAELSSSAKKLDDVAGKLYEASDILIEKFKEYRDTDPDAARRYAQTAATAANRATEINRQGAKIARDEAAAAVLKEERIRRENMRKAIEEFGEDEYWKNTVAGKNARNKKAQYDADLAEHRYYRRKFTGKGIKDNLRIGLGRFEDGLESRSGLIGIAARLGANLAKNTKFGDMFNKGIVGAGVNMGGIVGGGIALALKAAYDGLKKFATSATEATMSIEKLKTNLSVVYGKDSEANLLFDDIAKYSLKSPFGVKETTEQAILLKQSGVNNYELMETLKMVGDLAGGNQEKMTRISNALAQISSNEIANTRLLRTFTMAGVPIYKALARNLDTSTATVRKKVEGGEISYRDVINAMKLLTGPGGSFYESVEKGSKTYAARKTNFEDLKQISKASAADAFYITKMGKTWLGVKEDFYTWFKSVSDFINDKRIDSKVEKFRKVDSDYEKRIADAKAAGATDVVKYLKVEKMYAEKVMGITRDETEAREAERFKQAGERLSNKLATVPVTQERSIPIYNSYNTVPDFITFGPGGKTMYYNDFTVNKLKDLARLYEEISDAEKTYKQNPSRENFDNLAYFNNVYNKFSKGARLLGDKTINKHLIGREFRNNRDVSAYMRELDKRLEKDASLLITQRETSMSLYKDIANNRDEYIKSNNAEYELTKEIRDLTDAVMALDHYFAVTDGKTNLNALDAEFDFLGYKREFFEEDQLIVLDLLQEREGNIKKATLEAERIRSELDKAFNPYNKALAKIIQENYNQMSHWTWGKDGKRTRKWTNDEKSAYRVSTRIAANDAEERLISAKNAESTANKLSTFESFYKTTYGAKLESREANLEIVEELKKIYDEMLNMDLENNKFGFMYDENGNNKFLNVKDTLELMDRYFDNQNVEKLDFENSENFAETQRSMSENLNALKNTMKSGLISYAGGDTGIVKEVMSQYEQLQRATNNGDLTEMTQLIADIDKIMKEKIDNDDLKQLWSATLTTHKLVEIDRLKLDIIEKQKKGTRVYDTSYTPLIRELTEKYLGVSLFRTIGADLGARYDEKIIDDKGRVSQPSSRKTIDTTLSYARNISTREMNAALAKALLLQQGDKRISWKDIAANIVQNKDQFYKYKRQSYVSDTGERLTRSYGRYRKAYLDQNATGTNLMAFALGDNGTSATARSVASKLDETIGKYNDFFTEAFTSIETREATAKLLELKKEQENLAGVFGKDHEERKLLLARREDIATQIKQLEAESPLKQLGIEENEEYRTRFAAMSMKIDRLADGTERFNEIMMEELDLYNQELIKRKDMISVLSDMKQIMEDVNNDILEQRSEGLENNVTLLSSDAFSDIGDIDTRKEVLSKIISEVSKPENQGILNKAYGEGTSLFYRVEAILNEISRQKSGLYEGNGIAEEISWEESKSQRMQDVEAKIRKKDQLREEIKKIEKERKKFVDRVGTFEEFTGKATHEYTGPVNGSPNDFTSKTGIFYRDLIPNFNKWGYVVPEEDTATNPKKISAGGFTDYRWVAQSVLDSDKNAYNEFGSKDEFMNAIRDIWITNWTAFENRINALNAQINAIDTDIENLNRDGDFAGAFAHDANKFIITPYEGLSSAKSYKAYESYRLSLATNPEVSPLERSSFSFRDGFTIAYNGNTSKEQALINNMGLRPTESFEALVMDKYISSDGTLNLSEYSKLLTDMKSSGLSTNSLQQTLSDAFDEEGNLKNVPLTDKMIKGIKDADASLLSFKQTSLEVMDTLKNLAKSMEKAFDSAIVDGISNSMATLGESMRTGADATEEINKGLRETFTNLVKNIGPQMTETGLAIAIAGAQEGKAGWGKVMGGLGLAAAGGFLSWAGGFLGADDKDKDEEAQKEARLKSLADLLSDLIGQARTDAEYYERNMRHERAISADYGISSRSVNDMILTPNGTFSTHPDDYLIATKNPYALSTSGSPNVNITIVNQSGDVVKVASTTKKEKDNGDIDIQAVIVAVTADAIASGEMDGAFAQREARRNGVTRMY